MDVVDEVAQRVDWKNRRTTSISRFQHSPRLLPLCTRALERQRDRRKREKVGESDLENSPDSLGEGTALTNGNEVADLDTESGGAVNSDVLVALLVCEEHRNKMGISSRFPRLSRFPVNSSRSVSASHISGLPRDHIGSSVVNRDCRGVDREGRRGGAGWREE